MMRSPRRSSSFSSTTSVRPCRIGGHLERCCVEDLRHVGWQAYRVVTYVSWCGHAQEVTPFPREDGLVAFVPVLEEAR